MTESKTDSRACDPGPDCAAGVGGALEAAPIRPTQLSGLAPGNDEGRPTQTLDDIAEIRQALRELYHCVEVGPNWFTRGREGQLSHASAWFRRGETALKKIEGVEP